jgi:HPt (histidine-containing phosphotransfer) domain-containing protein
MRMAKLQVIVRVGGKGPQAARGAGPGVFPFPSLHAGWYNENRCFRPETPGSFGIMESAIQVDRGALQRLERIGGADLLVRVIDQFISRANQCLETACDSGKSGNLETLGKALRVIKEGAANLGASDVRDLAAHIERLAIQGGKDLILPLLCQLDEILHQTEDWLLSERKERVHTKGANRY